MCVEMVASDWVGMLFFAMSVSVTTIFQYYNVQKACIKDNTCESAHGVLRDTGFTNTLSSMYDNTYLHNLSVNERSTKSRGVCAVGDRPETNNEGSLTCVPFYPYPNAMDIEIQDTTSSVPHTRACGKWIRSGGVWTQAPLYRSMVHHLCIKQSDV